MRTKAAIAFLGFLLGLMTSCQGIFVVSLDLWTGRAEDVLTTSVSADGIQLIRVYTPNGSIAISADEEANEIHIRAELFAAGEDDAHAADRLEQFEVRVNASEDDPSILEIEAVLPETNGLVVGNLGNEASFVITIPVGIDVDLAADDGSVSVNGVEGNVTIETANGSIEVIDTVGNADLRTQNGSVTVTTLTGNVVVETSNGWIELEDVLGDAAANTLNGRITAIGVTGSISAETHNGSLRVRANLPEDGTIDVATRNGSIRIEVPVETAASLELGALFGVVLADLEGFVVTEFRSGPHSVRAILNGGGGTITATTRSGTILFAGF